MQFSCCCCCCCSCCWGEWRRADWSWKPAREWAEDSRQKTVKQSDSSHCHFFFSSFFLQPTSSADRQRDRETVRQTVGRSFSKRLWFVTIVQYINQSWIYCEKWNLPAASANLQLQLWLRWRWSIFCWLCCCLCCCWFCWVVVVWVALRVGRINFTLCAGAATNRCSLFFSYECLFFYIFFLLFFLFFASFYVARGDVHCLWLKSIVTFVWDEPGSCQSL